MRVVKPLLVALAACGAMVAVAAPAQPDPKAQPKATVEKAKDTQKVAVSPAQPSFDGKTVLTGEPAAVKPKGLYFERWVKDEDAKDKKGTDADTYR